MNMCAFPSSIYVDPTVIKLQFYIMLRGEVPLNKAGHITSLEFGRCGAAAC